MKKGLLKAGLLMSSVFLLAACGNSGDEESIEQEVSVEEQVTEEVRDAEPVVSITQNVLTYDGVLDENGWAVKYVINASDTGDIESVEFDYVNEEGDLKSEDADYIANMEEGSGNNIATTLEYLSNGLVGQNLHTLAEDFETGYDTAFGDDYTDVVTGATHTADNHKDLTQQLVDGYQAYTVGSNVTVSDLGDTIVFDFTGTRDGNGWTPTYHVNATSEGVIQDINFNYTDDSGNQKTNDEEYVAKMEEIAGNNISETIAYLNDGLVGVNLNDLVADFDNVYDSAFGDDYTDVVSGATHTADGFKSYVREMVNAYDTHLNTPTE